MALIGRDFCTPRSQRARARCHIGVARAGVIGRQTTVETGIGRARIVAGKEGASTDVVAAEGVTCRGCIGVRNDLLTDRGDDGRIACQLRVTEIEGR